MQMRFLICFLYQSFPLCVLKFLLQSLLYYALLGKKKYKQLEYEACIGNNQLISCSAEALMASAGRVSGPRI